MESQKSIKAIEAYVDGEVEGIREEKERAAAGLPPLVLPLRAARLADAAAAALRPIDIMYLVGQEGKISSQSKSRRKVSNGSNGKR